MDLDLRQLIQIARRRWWLVLLLMLVAGGSAYLSSSRQTPVYSATAVMIVSPGIASSASDYNSLLASERLAKTYEQLVNTQPMRERVASALGYDEIDPESILISIVPNSQLITVTVTDTDPQRATDTANALVAEFRSYIREQTALRVDETRANIDRQIETLRSRQSELDAQIADLESASDTDTGTLAQLRDERASINQSLTQLESDAVNIEMQTTAASVDVAMADPAQVPDTPISPKVNRSTALGIFVGLLLAVGLVALLEYLDNTVKGDTDVQGIAGAPVLASVSDLPKLGSSSQQVYVMSQPKTGAAEAIRLLRANLDFAGATQPVKTLTMTSSIAGEGKSTTAANLGVALAQSGKSVLLIDADLRKPMQHLIFGVNNSQGLSSLLVRPGWDVSTVVHRVALPGLSLISSGPVPPNPADLVTSPQFAALIEKARSLYDIVIIDTPPLLQATDALIVGTRTDGVVLVCQVHSTRVDAFRHSVAMLRQGNARIIGVVLNRTKPRGSEGYYSDYYGSDDHTARTSPLPR